MTQRSVLDDRSNKSEVFVKPCGRVLGSLALSPRNSCLRRFCMRCRPPLPALAELFVASLVATCLVLTDAARDPAEAAEPAAAAPVRRVIPILYVPRGPDGRPAGAVWDSLEAYEREARWLTADSVSTRLVATLEAAP